MDIHMNRQKCHVLFIQFVLNLHLSQEDKNIAV